MAWYNPTDPTQRNWMLGGLVAFILIVPFKMYWQGPKEEDNATIQTRLETLDRVNRQSQVTIARGGLQELQNRMALYERHVGRLEELIPTQDQVPELLNSINERSRARGVQVVGITPEASAPEGPYTRRGYQMTVVGEYHAVGSFMADIASLPRIVTPTQVSIERHTSPQTYPDMESPVLAGFRIETYVLLPPTDSSAAGAAPGQPGAPTGGGRP